MNLIGLMEIGTMYQEANNDYYFMWKDIVLDTRLNKDILMQEIVSKCGQMYPATQTVATFKRMNETFFKKWEYQISKLLDTQEYEYNAIWNKDVTDHDTRQVERILEHSRTEDIDENTNTDDKREIQTNGSDENTVSAYNSGDYQPHDKDIHDNHTSDTDNINTGRKRGTDEDINENEGTVEDMWHVSQGNQGVTTTQQMIREERDLYEFNIYNWIIEKYSYECFLKVW